MTYRKSLCHDISTLILHVGILNSNVWFVKRLTCGSNFNVVNLAEMTKLRAVTHLQQSPTLRSYLQSISK